MQKAFKNRWVKTGAQAVALTALILGLVSFVGANKTVAVTVDGQTQSVQAYGNTVADMLASASIPVGAGDKVSPSLDAAVDDGAAITVNRNKSVDVSIDGVDRVVHTTGLTVADVLDQLDVGDSADVSTGPQLELAALSSPLEISTEKTLALTADGKTRKLTTTEATVGQALKDAGITVGKDDHLSVDPDTEVKDGHEVILVRVETTTETVTEAIDHDVEKTKDNDLAVGKTKTLEQGHDGERTLTYTVTTHDGREFSRKLLDSKVTTQPVDTEVAVGTKKPEKKEPAKASTGGGTTASAGGVSSAWRALAQCESGGNWSINTGNGYYGGLQFSRSSWLGAGGGKYAAYPHQASPAEQVAVAEKLRASGGWGHWPACSSKLGLR
ncbi:transglycosylase family protein [Arthrobacter sp. JSM 101049]|uniref:transglycosylase family protein n=1 Tax=Arthrobacter sp. JSM 101049 TaxID=929097 RepID=UPI003562754B